MKTSKKIILTVAGVLLALLVSGLMILRSDLQGLSLSGLDYRLLPVSKFSQLDLKGNWVVRVRQRTQYQLEVEADAFEAVHSTVKVENDRLILKHSPSRQDSGRHIHLRISAPTLASVRAADGTKILLDDFHTDSIHIVLENGSSFAGTENILEYTTIQSSGNSWIQITDDPMK